MDPQFPPSGAPSPNRNIVVIAVILTVFCVILTGTTAFLLLRNQTNGPPLSSAKLNPPSSTSSVASQIMAVVSITPPLPTITAIPATPLPPTPSTDLIQDFIKEPAIADRQYQDDAFGFIISYPSALAFDKSTLTFTGPAFGKKRIVLESALNSVQTCRTQCTDMVKRISSVTISGINTNLLAGSKKNEDGTFHDSYLTYEFYPKNGYWTYLTMTLPDGEPTASQLLLFQKMASSFYYFPKPTSASSMTSQSSSVMSIPQTAKPVIYLYPEKKTDVYVRLDYDGKLLTTYPAYDNSISGWKVTAYPNGRIVDKTDGEEYSYIFWDGITRWNNMKIDKGFVVQGTETKRFLQSTLKRMGLLPKEYNEFIVYWLPKLEKNPYNLIHFAGSQYTESAKLTISPKQDSMLRVYMVYEPLTKKIDIPKQEIKPFVRKGFTVVEWGGRSLE